MKAIEFIEKIKEKHKDATHNVFAYIIYSDTEIYKYSDDKEPSGTAGRPILDLLRKENLINIVVVVTRYFGGTLLGKGGLVRAYSQSARLGIEKAEIVNNILHYDYELIIDYSNAGKVENEMLNMNHIIYDKSFGQNVYLKFMLGMIKKTLKNIMDITNGQIDIKFMGEKFVSFSRESHYAIIRINVL